MRTAAFLILLLLIPSAAAPSPVHEFSIAISSEHNQISDTDQNAEFTQTIQASIEIIGTWSKTHLKVRVIPSGVTGLDEAAFRGVSTWYDVISEFVRVYGYGHLSSLSYEFVNNEAEADITIEYVSSLGGNVCGLASLRQNFITREILRVEIRISRSCVGVNSATAYKVVAHEYGHALGLGHSSYDQDLMYERVNVAEQPSTLNLYALAVAYSWIRDGRFQRVSLSSIALPPDIPYAYIIPRAEIYTVRILIESELGQHLLREYQLRRGTLFRYEFEREIDFGNATKIVFNSWNENDGRVFYLRSLEFVVSRDVDIVGRYSVFYYVAVTGLGVDTKGWFRKGSELYFTAEEIVDFGNDTRLVFDRWSDGITANSRRLIVDKPIEINAMYEKQYRVYVESFFDLLEGDGWFFEGQLLKLSINDSVVEVGGGIRFRLTKIIYQDMEFDVSRELEIVVDKPIHLRTNWAVEYFVTVVSTHGAEILFERWMENGSMLLVEAPDEIVWDNNTKAVFSKWSIGRGDSSYLNLLVTKPLYIIAEYRIYYFVEIDSLYPTNIKSGWVEKGTRIFLDTGPRLREIADGRRVKFVGWTDMDGDLWMNVTKPVKLSAHWVEEIRIIVTKPSEISVTWVPIGSVVEIEAEPIIQVDSGRRLVFSGFGGDVDDVQGNKVTIYVDTPKVVSLEYYEEMLVSFITQDSDGFFVPAEIRLKTESGMLSLLPFTETWLRSGLYQIDRIVFNDVDVKKSDTLTLSSPGEYRLKVNVYGVKVKVVDLLGVPLVGSSVKLERETGRLEGFGKVNSWGEIEFTNVTPEATLGTVEYLMLRHAFVLEPEKEFVEVRMGLSVQAISSILLAILLIALAVAKHKERMKGDDVG